MRSVRLISDINEVTGIKITTSEISEVNEGRASMICDTDYFCKHYCLLPTNLITFICCTVICSSHQRLDSVQCIPLQSGIFTLI